MKDYLITLNNHSYKQHNVLTSKPFIILHLMHIFNNLLNLYIFLNVLRQINMLKNLIILIIANYKNIITGGLYFKYSLLIHYIAPNLILPK